MSQERSATVHFLSKAACLYKDACPEQARFLMRRIQSKSGEPFPEEAICPFCFQSRCPDGHRVRVRPKRKAPPQVLKLLRREAACRPLSLEQARILRRFWNSCNKLMATCHTCSRTSRQRGASRAFVTTKSHSTPGGTSTHRTPQSVNRALAALPKGPSDMTPSRTPRSTSSETPGSASSKSGSVKKSAFARLRRFLMVEDKQKRQSGSLKDFLSSL